MKYLIQCNIEYDESDNIWFINPNLSAKERGHQGFKFKATPNMVRGLLFKLKAKDDMKSPRSLKKLTYKQIVDEIMDNTDNIVYFWSNFYPKSKEELDNIFLTIKEKYNKTIDLAKEIFGEDFNKHNNWIEKTYQSLLKENKTMSKNIFMQYVESDKEINEFLCEMMVYKNGIYSRVEDFLETFAIKDLTIIGKY